MEFQTIYGCFAHSALHSCQSCIMPSGISDDLSLLCAQCFALLSIMYHAQWNFRRSMVALRTVLCTHVNHVSCPVEFQTIYRCFAHSALHSCQSCIMPIGATKVLTRFVLPPLQSRTKAWGVFACVCVCVCMCACACACVRVRACV